MTPLDPDPLHVDDERIPSSKPYRLVPDSPRRGCSVLGFLVLAGLVFVGSATPRTADQAPRTVPGGPSWMDVDLPSGAPHREAGHDPVGAPQPAVGIVRERSAANLASQAEVSMPAQDASSITWEGTLAFALPSYGDRYLAIRQPRGTRVVVCGPSDCVTRISTDFGPSPEMARQGRIADLSAADFQRVCGVPLSFGLCPGTVTLAGLPATDQ